MKRICILCDGTWQDGISTADENSYTNVLRLARALEPYDDRPPAAPATATATTAQPSASGSAGHPDSHPGVHQLVYYSSGVGSEPNFSSWSGGITGAGLVTKVEEAYSFICMNWAPADEIVLFGFSRGAYTARMVAGIVNEIGILGKVAQEEFPTLFLAMQNVGKHPHDPAVKSATDKILNPYRANKELQAKQAPSGFLVKSVGVFDTVESIGLPQEIRRRLPSKIGTFGFSNTDLGKYVEHGFQALALNEKRDDFRPILWTQAEEGRKRGQTVKQVWFPGSHSDIGGGWETHDLSDITLAWMVSETMHLVKYDERYIEGIPDCTYPWGKAPPHNSSTGIFAFGLNSPRTPATTHNPHTHEYIHPSVLEQDRTPTLTALLDKLEPTMFTPLLPFEDKIRAQWHHTPGCKPRKSKKTLAQLHHMGRLSLSEMFGFGKAKTKGLLGYIELGQTPPVVQNAVAWIGVELGNIKARIESLLGMKKKRE